MQASPLVEPSLQCDVWPRYPLPTSRSSLVRQVLAPSLWSKVIATHAAPATPITRKLSRPTRSTRFIKLTPREKGAPVLSFQRRGKSRRDHTVISSMLHNKSAPVGHCYRLAIVVGVSLADRAHTVGRISIRGPSERAQPGRDRDGSLSIESRTLIPTTTQRYRHTWMRQHSGARCAVLGEGARRGVKLIRA